MRRGRANTAGRRTQPRRLTYRRAQNRLLQIFDYPEARGFADVQARRHGERRHPRGGSRLDRVEAGDVRDAQRVRAADEHGVVITPVDERLREAERHGGRGTGGGDHPRFAADFQRARQRLAETVKLRLQIHHLVKRTRTAPVFPGVFRLGRGEAAVAGAEDDGDVAADFAVGRRQAGVLPRRGARRRWRSANTNLRIRQVRRA